MTVSYDTAYFEGREIVEPFHAWLVMEWIERFKPKRVLDYGCGSGRYVRLFRDFGVEADGYDPHVEEWKEEPKGDYDLVLCVDVLEHVLDEWDVRSVLCKIRAHNPKHVVFSICFAGDPNFPLDPTHRIYKNRSWWQYVLMESEYSRIEQAPPSWAFSSQWWIAEVA